MPHTNICDETPYSSNEILPAPSSSFCGWKIDVFESKMIPREDKTIYHIKIGGTKTCVLTIFIIPSKVCSRRMDKVSLEKSEG